MDNVAKNSDCDNLQLATQSPVYINYVSCIKIDGVPILPPLVSIIIYTYLF